MATLWKLSSSTSVTTGYTALSKNRTFKTRRWQPSRNEGRRIWRPGGSIRSVHTLHHRGQLICQPYSSNGKAKHGQQPMMTSFVLSCQTSFRPPLFFTDCTSLLQLKVLSRSILLGWLGASLPLLSRWRQTESYMSVLVCVSRSRSIGAASSAGDA